MLDTHCIKGYLCKGKSERGFQHEQAQRLKKGLSVWRAFDRHVTPTSPPGAGRHHPPRHPPTRPRVILRMQPGKSLAPQPIRRLCCAHKPPSSAPSISHHEHPRKIRRLRHRRPADQPVQFSHPRSERGHTRPYSLFRHGAAHQQNLPQTRHWLLCAV